MHSENFNHLNLNQSLKFKSNMTLFEVFPHYALPNPVDTTSFFCNGLFDTGRAKSKYKSEFDNFSKSKETEVYLAP